MAHPSWTRTRLARVMAVALSGAATPPLGAPVAEQPLRFIDARKSLAVTDQVILQRFPFSRVMRQLVAQSGASDLTELQLFQEWWDSQNPGPGAAPGATRHCDDVSVVDPATGLEVTALNGHPYDCRPDPSEGIQAALDPFADEATSPAAYMPIGLFNRFDLAPFDGRHCGEYRIVFGRRSGVLDPSARSFVIFEATLPNPSPSAGLEGCYPVAKFWAALTLKRVNARAAALEAFYFDGVQETDRNGAPVTIGPVVHVDNYGQDRSRGGQVRTNQFMRNVVWNLREFKLVRGCAGCTDAPRFLPATAKDNPFGPLFSSTVAWPQAAAFKVWFAGNLDGLLGSDLGGLRLGTPDVFNSGQSHASASIESALALQAGFQPSAFRDAIQARLDATGSTLTVDNVIQRAQTQTCAGCHAISDFAPLGGGLNWPPALGFVHVSERFTEEGPAGTRFELSPALKDVFLPRRLAILQDFVRGLPPPRQPGQQTLSGALTH